MRFYFYKKKGRGLEKFFGRKGFWVVLTQALESLTILEVGGGGAQKVSIV